MERPTKNLTPFLYREGGKFKVSLLEGVRFSRYREKSDKRFPNPLKKLALEIPLFLVGLGGIALRARDANEVSGFECVSPELFG